MMILLFIRSQRADSFCERPVTIVFLFQFIELPNDSKTNKLRWRLSESYPRIYDAANEIAENIVFIDLFMLTNTAL